MAKTKASPPRVVLIPWDPNSKAQLARMVEQRKQCGWHSEIVPTVWRDAHLSGQKYVFWLAFAHDEPRRDMYHQLHQATCKMETTEIVDTSKTLLGQPREATYTSFLPVGHIGIGMHNAAFTDPHGLQIPEIGSYWIKSFFVSFALQGLGVGGAAMAVAESLVRQAPLHAKYILLDAPHKEDQVNKSPQTVGYGKLVENPCQSWYERRGYQPIGYADGLYADPDPTGKIWPCRTVFMRKDVC
jgi:GNAT superfamily N-acetyltransferase